MSVLAYLRFAMCCDLCNASLSGAGVDYLRGIVPPARVAKRLILADACSGTMEALSRGWRLEICLT